MLDKIKQRLYQIEKDHEVRILYAVESGSQAWGFASQDSDYDVRFIYAHPQDWYITVQQRRDVIEYLDEHPLDISGWDLRKGLQLFYKSNPPLLEWLQSPIVYLEQYTTAKKMRSMMQSIFSPQSCMYHYLHMAEGNYREYLKGEHVKVKKYFYVLRPVLACKWIEKYNTMPPTEFELLFNDQQLQDGLHSAIDRLLKRKKDGEELATEPRISAINEFLENEIIYYTHFVKSMPKVSTNMEMLDVFFRETLREVWV